MLKKTQKVSTLYVMYRGAGLEGRQNDGRKNISSWCVICFVPLNPVVV